MLYVKLYISFYFILFVLYYLVSKVLKKFGNGKKNQKMSLRNYKYIAGQKVQNNASLPSGTYFVHYGTQVKKVVVR